MTISSRNVFGDLSHSATASCVYFIDNYLADIFFKWKFNMKWTILSFSKFLGAMLGQISRTHFLFNGKFAIEISWARNWIHFFHWQILSATVRSKDFLLSFQLWQIPQGKNCKDKQLYFFNGIFFNKQNTWSRVVKAHLFEWQTACKTQSYFGCFKRKTDIKHHFVRMLLPLGKFSGNCQGKNFNHFFFDGKFVGADFFSPSWWQIL